jgi:hypothetical protein
MQGAAGQVQGRVRTLLLHCWSLIPHPSSKQHPSVIANQRRTIYKIKHFRTISDRNKLHHAFQSGASCSSPQGNHLIDLLSPQRGSIRIICSSLGYLLTLFKHQRSDRDFLDSSGIVIDLKPIGPAQTDHSYGLISISEDDKEEPVSECSQGNNTLLRHQLVHRSRPAAIPVELRSRSPGDPVPAEIDCVHFLVNDEAQALLLRQERKTSKSGSVAVLAVLSQQVVQ